MSTTMMIGAGIATWVLVAILIALVVGKILQRRDGHRPVEGDPLPAKASVPGGLTSGHRPTAPPDEDQEQPSLRRGRH